MKHRTPFIWRALAVVTVAALLGGGVLASEQALRAEETRTTLIRLIDTFARLAPATDADLAPMRRVRQSLDNATPATLDSLAAAYGSTDSLRAALTRLDGGARFGDDASGRETVGTLADPAFSEACGSMRADAQTALDQLALVEETLSAAAAAQAACDAAEAMDVAAACEAAAMAADAAIAARTAYEQTLVCWGDIDAAVLDAALASIGENADALDGLSGDVETLSDGVESLSGDVATLSGDVATLSGDVALLSGDVAAVAQALEDHDAAVQQAIADLASSLQDALDAVLANQTVLLENQEELRVLLLTPQGRRPGWNGRPIPGDDGTGDTTGNGNNGNGNGNGNNGNNGNGNGNN